MPRRETVLQPNGTFFMVQKSIIVVQKWTGKDNAHKKEGKVEFQN